jgi:hypothetical protein
MSKVSVSLQNLSRPAPKQWRKFEDAMLTILIPAIVLIVTSWGFKNEALANKITLLVNVGLVALIKVIGKLLANGEEYAPVQPVEENKEA